MSLFVILLFISIRGVISWADICINSTTGMQNYIREHYLEDFQRLLSVSGNQMVSLIHFTITTYDGLYEERWIWSRTPVYIDIFPQTLEYTSLFAIKPIDRIMNLTIPSFCNLTEEERDQVISYTLLRIREFAENPDTVAQTLYLCWMTPAETLEKYEWECWTSYGDYFRYTGYYSWTIQLLTIVAAIAFITSIVAVILYSIIISISHKELEKSLLKIICCITFIVHGVISSIGVYYEAKINATDPRITSDFFIACWVISGVNMIFILLTIICIKLKSDRARISAGINFFFICLFFS